MSLKEKAKTTEEIRFIANTAEDQKMFPRYTLEEEWVLLAVAEAALNSAQSEIQQLKEQLDERTHKNIQLTCKVEAAKTMIENDLELYDIWRVQDMKEILKVLAGETT